VHYIAAEMIEIRKSDTFEFIRAELFLTRCAGQRLVKQEVPQLRGHGTRTQGLDGAAVHDGP